MNAFFTPYSLLKKTSYLKLLSVMIDHDRLFKELLSTFLIEFIELFFPQVMTYLEPDSITFIDKEIFTDVTAGDR